MSKLILLVGPPGSGKSTMAKDYEAQGFVRISQDDQGKTGHIEAFRQAIRDGKDVIVDRMNFSVEQRRNYLQEAPHYEREIIVLHQPYKVCLERMLKREGHPTIQDEKSARGALQTFITKYERPEPNSGFKLTFIYPEGEKKPCIVVDLDGTLCNVEHRRHHVRRTDGQKKDWAAFFRDIPLDPVNQWCADIVAKFAPTHQIVFCSGRDDNQRQMTKDWLADKLGLYETDDYVLYMRNRHDSRQDSIVKENILDFEILTRFAPYFMIDDRKQVVDMWRKRGFVCLQCDEGDF